uniref:Pectate lyase superfamily protein domain-containing protein n=1 Tax=Leersia perrieri TaxID=77586 RepID=A0A0D9XUZ1_9ORYZ
MQHSLIIAYWCQPDYCSLVLAHIAAIEFKHMDYTLTTAPLVTIIGPAALWVHSKLRGLHRRGCCSLSSSRCSGELVSFLFRRCRRPKIRRKNLIFRAVSWPAAAAALLFSCGVSISSVCSSPSVLRRREEKGLMKKIILVVIPFLLLAILESVDGGCDGDEQETPPGVRPHSVTITEFGAVGDGKTLNTLPFQNAVFYARSFADKGGAQLYVPKGRWLTGSFNLTSHLTLFLEEGAVIIGTKDPSQWPIVEPLPSYGQGIDLLGPRHRSLINGYNLSDVVITGNKGVIDGQGSIWWDWLQSHELNHSRPHIVEFLYSEEIIISNLTFLNSPAWSIHPTYCSNVKVHNVTIKTPLDAPLTDGIVPDSCSNMCIEDSTISVGHDAISLKSGWDNYGISFGRPTSDIHINNMNLQASSGAAIAFGSEMSGGIWDIHANYIHVYESSRGISFRTAPGRGSYIVEVVITDVEMDSVYLAIEFNGNWSSHPDDYFDPSMIPLVDQITLKNMKGTNISVAGVLSGIAGAPFNAICLSNLNFTIADSTPPSSWSCSDVYGYSELVFPEPCSELQNPFTNTSTCFSLSSYSALAVA